MVNLSEKSEKGRDDHSGNEVRRVRRDIQILIETYIATVASLWSAGHLPTYKGGGGIAVVKRGKSCENHDYRFRNQVKEISPPG